MSTVRKLRDLAIVAAGQGAPQGEKNYCTDGIPFIKAGNLIELLNGKKESAVQNVSEEVAKRHRLKLYPAGTVLFAKSGMSCMKGYVYILQSDCYVVSHLTCIIPLETTGAYLKYYFEYHRPNSLIKDEAYPSISLSDIGNLDIRLEEPAKQAAIVNNLDRINTLIKCRQDQLRKIDNLVKSQFIEMFGDPITNPKAWRISVWETVLRIVNGRNQKAVQEVDGEYPIYGSGGEMGRANNFLCNENSVVIGRKGNINKPLFVKTKFWNVDTAFGLEPESNLLAEYLYYFCLQYNFELHNKAVTIPSLTKRDLLKITMPLPPLSLQNEFARFVEQTDKSKFRIKQSLEKLEKCYKALLQKYFG